MQPSLHDLPPELLLCIANYADKAVLNSLTQTCVYTYTIFNEYLYRLEARSTGGVGLVWAAYNGEAGTVKRLLDAGVLANGMQTYLDGVPTVSEQMYGEEGYSSQCYLNTPLHLAARRGHVEVVRLLLDSGVHPDCGYAALKVVDLSGHRRTSDEWLGYGSWREAESHSTALYVAAAHARPDVVRLLLDYGADDGIVGLYGRTALEAAVSQYWYGDHPESPLAVTRMLLALPGVDVHARNSSEHTLLITAVLSRFEDVVSMLLADYQADSNDFILSTGQTVLELAVMEGDEALTRLLLRYGADPTTFMEPWPHAPALWSLERKRMIGVSRCNRIVMEALGPLAAVGP